MDLDTVAVSGLALINQQLAQERALTVDLQGSDFRGLSFSKMSEKAMLFPLYS